METAKVRIAQCLLLAGTAFLAGCAGQSLRPAPTRVAIEGETTTAAVIQAAEKVFARMHFPIEKLDVEQGIIRTRPLRAGQFFEFWRNDNVGASNTAEANFQTIRRAVEVRVADDSGELHVDCDVWVQRLSLPENEVASISQAYRMHSESVRGMQRLELTPEQEEAMVWMDLGKDPRLAAEIVRRIAKKLEQPKEEEAT